MPRRKRQAKVPPTPESPTTAGGLFRVSCYFHDDELRSIEQLAHKWRTSRADAIRRIVREHFKIED